VPRIPAPFRRSASLRGGKRSPGESPGNRTTGRKPGNRTGRADRPPASAARKPGARAQIQSQTEQEEMREFRPKPFRQQPAGETGRSDGRSPTSSTGHVGRVRSPDHGLQKEVASLPPPALPAAGAMSRSADRLQRQRLAAALDQPAISAAQARHHPQAAAGIGRARASPADPCRALPCACRMRRSVELLPPTPHGWRAGRRKE
jgi:hypothetical protein